MGNKNGKGEEMEGRLGELCTGRKQSLRSNVGRKWKETAKVEKPAEDGERKKKEESFRREEQF